MNNNDQLFELMTKMYGEMQEGFKKVDTEIQGVKGDIKEVKGDIKGIKGDIKEVKERVGNLENRMVKMEDDNHRNFTALFDGYKQNTEILVRVEKEVSRHEEIILRRVK